MNKLVPCFYYPTTIVFVDDDQDLLNSLQLSISNGFKCKTFVSANEAKNYILKNREKYDLRKNKYFSVNYEDLSEFSIGVDISKIHKEILNVDRFNESFILVVDYDMPEMNGLELASLLKNECNIKIIMLTGEAGMQTAVDAFNDGKIDRFLLKSTIDYGEQLLKYIHDLSLDFSSERTRSIFDSINKNGNHPLQDADFINEFNKICHDNQICEYYILDDSGSFLMNDVSGKNPLLMVVRTPSDMKTFYEIAEDDPDATSETLKSLKSIKKLPYAFNDDGLNGPLKEWILRESKKIDGKDIYYCLSFDKKDMPVDMSNVLSYEEFLDSE